jgi:hypothetical protein
MQRLDAEAIQQYRNRMQICYDVRLAAPVLATRLMPRYQLNLLPEHWDTMEHSENS